MGVDEARQGEPLGHRTERELHVPRAFRAPQVTGHDRERACVQRELDRWQRRLDARVVADDAVLDRDVEIDPDEDAPAAQIEVADRQLHEFNSRIEEFRNGRVEPNPELTNSSTR